MARGKKPVAKRATKKTTARGKAQKAAQKLSNADLSASLKEQTAQIKLLVGTWDKLGKDNSRRPPNNPDMPQNIIDNLNQDFNAIKELLDNFSQHLRALDRCRKARGFSAWSLRYAQTPHINSRSFAKHNISQKSIVSCQIKKNNKNCNPLFGKTPSYTA
jgi:hypothetical protein